MSWTHVYVNKYCFSYSVEVDQKKRKGKKQKPNIILNILHCRDAFLFTSLPEHASDLVQFFFPLRTALRISKYTYDSNRQTSYWALGELWEKHALRMGGIWILKPPFLVSSPLPGEGHRGIQLQTWVCLCPDNLTV